MDIICHADGGKPPANLSLYLGKFFLDPIYFSATRSSKNSISNNRLFRSIVENEQIQYDERPILYGRQGDHAAVLKTSRSVTPEDHGKVLKCIATHIALKTPLSVQRQINVICEYNTFKHSLRWDWRLSLLYLQSRLRNRKELSVLDTPLDNRVEWTWQCVPTPCPDLHGLLTVKKSQLVNLITPTVFRLQALATR